MHTWDSVTPAEEVIRTMDDLVPSGKVRHVTLFDAPAWYVAQAQTNARIFGELSSSSMSEIQIACADEDAPAQRPN